jgi:hypothetical protein
MREALRGLGWVAALGCFAACSSNGVVLETLHGDPAPSHNDAGEASTMADSGPPKGVDPDSLRSGTRIHVRVQVSDGELLSVVGMHDTLRDVDCSLHVADDGVTRCLPDLPSVSSGVIYPSGVVYTDPDCTGQPLILVNPGAAPCYGPPAPPAYKLWSAPRAPTSQCFKSAPTHVLTPGAQIQPPEQLYSSDNFTCQPTSAVMGSIVYATNTSPASDWVAFERTAKPLTSQLGIIQWSGSDGSRFRGDTILLSNGKPCDASDGYSAVPYSAAPPGTVSRCTPSNVQSLNVYFSDAACSTGIALVDPNCDPPELLIEPGASSDPCSSPAVGYFALGDVIHSPVYSIVLSSTPGSCQPAGTEIAGQVAYAKGAPVDLTIYPTMQAVLTGSGRIRHYEWQSEGVSIADAGNWTDSATGAPVTATGFDDGVTRGVFSTSGTEKFFSDSDCKTWMLSTYPPSDTCSPPQPLPRWVSFDAIPTTVCEGTGTQSSVRPVLGKHKGQVYTLNPDINVEMNGACSEYVPSKTTTQYDFYDLGKPISASSLFAEITTIDL